MRYQRLIINHHLVDFNLSWSRGVFALRQLGAGCQCGSECGRSARQFSSVEGSRREPRRHGRVQPTAQSMIPIAYPSGLLHDF